jgi:alpha-mannosidase
MEQGERRYHFILAAGGSAERLRKVDREAAVLNMPPYLLPFCPSGEGRKPAALVEINKENVSLSCFKRSEDDEAASIVRVFEAQGIDTEFTLTIPVLNLRHTDRIKAFEIRTYRADRKGIVTAGMLENEP